MASSIRGIEDVPSPELPCLGHGYVQLAEVMGSDEVIVQEARNSYGKGTTHFRSPRGLLRFLMRHRHTSPFEFGVLRFHLKMPISVSRQLFRHRTASANEHSLRYSEALEDTEIPDAGEWRHQSKANRQGSSGLMSTDEGMSITHAFLDAEAKCRNAYKHALEKDAAREQARDVLPLGTCTVLTWKMDIHNLLHFLKLRLASDAQQEIREYAEAMYRFVQVHFPLTAEAFRDYVLDAITLSGPEIRAFNAAVHEVRLEAMRSTSHVALDRELVLRMFRNTEGNSTREIQELDAKLRLLGFA